MGNKQDEKLIAITHSTQIWAMTNKGLLKKIALIGAYCH
jgi:hypothetical protein